MVQSVISGLGENAEESGQGCSRSCRVIVGLGSCMAWGSHWEPGLGCCGSSCAQALPGEQQEGVVPCLGSSGAWSVQPVQVGKTEVGLEAASEPQRWDLHCPLAGDSPHLLWCQLDMAEGVLVLSGVELISFPVAVQFRGFCNENNGDEVMF